MRRIPTPAAAPAAVARPAPSAVSGSPPSPAPSVAQGWPGQELLDTPQTAQVLHDVWSGDPAVLVPSPPGAGKTRLVSLLAAALTERAGLRVGVAAQTREQAAEIARRIGRHTTRGLLIYAANQPAPDSGATPAVRGNRARFPSTGGGTVIATTAWWLFAEPSRMGCDVMVVDEAWQSTYADVGALGAFAPQIVCVGDTGQIDPVVTGTVQRWATNLHGPQVPAPDAILARHGDAVNVIALPHTWRLGPETTALIQPRFYPDLPFTSRRPPEYVATPDGDRLPEVTHRPVVVAGGPTDPALAAACAERARTLAASTLDENGTARPTSAADVAVVCPHVTQAATVRAMLADLPDVLVGTANQLQGLERPAVVALHPFAGYRHTGGFAADTGRACVMLSRHRAHLSVVLDPRTATLLATDNDEPALHLHRQVLDDLLATPAV